MKLRSVFLIGTLSLAASISSQLRAETPASTQSAPTALETAKLYTNLMKAGKGPQAVETYWNFDAMFDSIFGDDMKKVSADDRAEMRRLMLRLIGGVYANPKINEAMAKASFGGFKSNEQGNHQVVVDFAITLEAGQVLPNTLYMVEGAKGWQIVDAAANAKPMVPAIRTEYQSNPKGTTPLQYIRAMTGQK